MRAERFVIKHFFARAPRLRGTGIKLLIHKYFCAELTDHRENCPTMK
jgi:hypothetical protein